MASAFGAARQPRSNEDLLAVLGRKKTLARGFCTIGYLGGGAI